MGNQCQVTVTHVGAAQQRFYTTQHKVHLVGSKRVTLTPEDDWKKCINYSVLLFLHLKTQMNRKVPPEKKVWKLCQMLKFTNATQNNEMIVVSQMIVTWNQDRIFSVPRRRLMMMSTTCCCCCCCCCTDVTDIINRVEYQTQRQIHTKRE